MKPLTRRELLRFMRTHGACAEATAWVRKTKGTPAQLWRKCHRWIWMQWLAGKAGGEVARLRELWLSDPAMDGIDTDGIEASVHCRRALPWRLVGPHVARAVRK